METCRAVAQRLVLSPPSTRRLLRLLPQLRLQNTGHAQTLTHTTRQRVWADETAACRLGRVRYGRRRIESRKQLRLAMRVPRLCKRRSSLDFGCVPITSRPLSTSASLFSCTLSSHRGANFQRFHFRWFFWSQFSFGGKRLFAAAGRSVRSCCQGRRLGWRRDASARLVAPPNQPFSSTTAEQSAFPYYVCPASTRGVPRFLTAASK